MSEFLEKSTQSLSSARLMVKESYYSSTVNRSYYACFQYLLYILFVKLNKNQEEYYQEVRAGKRGSHKWATNLVSIELAKKDMADYKWFQKHLPELKGKREDADYFPVVISQSDGHEAITKAENLIGILKKNFK